MGWSVRLLVCHSSWLEVYPGNGLFLWTLAVKGNGYLPVQVGILSAYPSGDLLTCLSEISLLGCCYACLPFVWMVVRGEGPSIALCCKLNVWVRESQILKWTNLSGGLQKSIYPSSPSQRGGPTRPLGLSLLFLSMLSVTSPAIITQLPPQVSWCCWNSAFVYWCQTEMQRQFWVK